ncbi:MAG: DUF420 domain-containing protein [Planctomycetota bacterium]
MIALASANLDSPFAFLSHVNAALNLLAFVTICFGLVAIKQRKEELHKKLMLTAFGFSAVFLVCYLVYHYQVGSVEYEGEGFLRTLYFTILIPHVVLAAVQVPLIILTLRAGFKDDRARHKKLAKITAPIWMFVSVSGVVVYLMLYQF